LERGLLSEKYRNRRKRFKLRFNLIAGHAIMKIITDFASGLIFRKNKQEKS